ncbi:MAG: antirestriction protein ArdA [Nanoarchaeota archaeon]|nr:antirestriction protein ArdA [Nanoarchaeota archaeon]
MKIAITDLKDYNESILRFEWLDLEEVSSKDEIGDFIENFLAKRSKETKELHEEWFVTDYEEFVDLGEYPNLEDIETAVKLGQEYGWETVSAYYSCYHEFEHLEEAYVGTYKDEEDFAYELAQDIYSEEQLGPLSIYIDWEKYARDLFIGDYYSEKLENYKIVVFRRW